MANRRADPVGYQPFAVQAPLADGLLSVQRDDGSLQRKVAQGMANLADQYGQEADAAAARAGAAAGKQAAFDGAPGAGSVSGGDVTGTASVNGQAGHISGSQGGYTVLAGSGADQAAAVLRHEEGFEPKPYWDTNAYRVGYGSDTVTLADGTVQKVRQGMSVTQDDAERDLKRRIASGEGARARDQVGADTFEKLPGGAQAALISVAYNYGSLPDGVVTAAKSGDLGAVATVVRGLSANPDRRKREAQLITGSIGHPDPVAEPAGNAPYVDPQVAAANPGTIDPAAPPAGLVEPGNIDLAKRPQVKNADGSVSTVRSISIEQDGKEILIPTVSPEGKVLSNDDAVALFKKTGQHLGKFDTAADATAYAEQLHQAQAKFYGVEGGQQISPGPGAPAGTPAPGAPAAFPQVPGYAHLPSAASVAPISVTPVRSPIKIQPGRNGTFRPLPGDTIYARAYNVQGTQTYLQELDLTMLQDQSAVYDKYKDDPSMLQTALGELKQQHLKDHVFSTIAPEYSVAFDKQALGLVEQSKAAFDTKKKAADKMDFLERVQTLEDHKSQTLAGLQPNDAAGATSLSTLQSGIDSHYDAAVSRGILSPEEATRYKRSSRSDAVTGFYTKQAANLSADEIKSMRGKMTADYAAGKLEGVGADDWDRISKGLVASEDARRTQDTKANADLASRGDDIAKRVARGLPVDPQQMARFQLDASTAPKGKDIVASTMVRMKIGEAIRTQPIGDVEKELPLILGQGANPEDYDFAKKAIADHRKDLETDPLGVAERFGILPAYPALPLDGDVDPALMAEAFTERVNAAKAAAGHFGVPPKFFRAGEADQIEAAVKSDPKRGLAIAAGLVSGGGPDAEKILSELGKSAPAVSQSGAIIAAGGDPKAALDLIAGYGKSPDGNDYPDMPNTKRIPIAKEETGGALAFTPEEQTRLDAAAGAIARKRIYDAGLKANDPAAAPIYQRAYQEAAGATFSNDVQFGGFGNYDPGIWWKSRKVVVPTDIRADKFQDVVQSLADGDVGDIKAKNGKSWTAADFKKALPVAVKGGYVFALGDPAGSSPMFIADQAGKPVVLDIAGMKDKLSARNPGAYK
ncbi:lysozyme [Rhizobium tumorigenes]|uniref:lysozyme n=1 Tax=Rhizobium tumorigenes TaxID=2041385 RepID=UPI00241C516E|nr:hypothetical protein [Rhizobium tumorigenes]WFS02216.1 hypothetical protein PR016_06275 [Rhizobium tumorigenes]